MVLERFKNYRGMTKPNFTHQKSIHTFLVHHLESIKFLQYICARLVP